MLEGLRRWLVENVRRTTEPRNPVEPRVYQSPRTESGAVITADTTLTIAAAWRCVAYLSQSVAGLPWRVLKDGNRGPEIQARHPVDWLLHMRPTDEWSSFQLRETLISWALRWGNGYAEIERDTRGGVFGLNPIAPWRVEPRRDAITGELFYRVGDNDIGMNPTRVVDVPARDMFHLRGYGDGPVGVSVATYAAQSLGWARALQIFGAQFFGSGAMPSLIIMDKEPLSEPALKTKRARFNELFGNSRRRERVAFLDNGSTATTLGYSAEQAMISQQADYLIQEVCRWFGVPPHKVYDLSRATFSNIEHQGIEVVQDSLTPWARRLEDEANYKLLGQNRQSLYTKINLRGLLRGDSAARVAYYESMLRMGAYSPNRVLELEDENTIGPEGDEHFMQSQMATLESIIDPPDPVAPMLAPPADNDDAEVDEDADEDADEELTAIERRVIAALALERVEHENV